MVGQSPQQIHFGRRWRGFTSLHRVLCALLASLQLLLPSLAAALPSDGHVVGGNATIQHTSPTTLNIQQTTEKAILNWQSFSIGANESVRFFQPSVNAIALNRVVGADPSVILGHLQANGRIFLLNPNGILFGAGAQINVGGLLATTLQIRDDDFMAGRYLFAQDPLKGMHTVVNRGTIQVSEHGYVFLVAPGVSNEGVIVANLGKVVLGSGQKLTLDLMGDGLINYAISGKVLDQVMGPDGKPISSAVSNSGTIQADGGHVILQAKASGDIFSSVVNQSGVIRARSLENHEGVVQLLGGDETLVAATSAGAMRPAGEVSGAVVNTGTIDVSAGTPNAAQGSVTMVGERVGQFGSITATGAEGANGGAVVIASTVKTLLADNSTINVSGIGHSSGGRLHVWSDQETLFNAGATIIARGGELSGNGGFVEVSAKENLGFAGTVNALAPFGSAGTLLLDPRNIIIATAGGVAYNPGVNNLFGNNVGATTRITPASINGQAANVILQANTDITVTNAIAMTNNGVGITMQAGRSIAVNANVGTNNGAISLVANNSVATAADRAAGIGNIRMAAGTTLNAGSGSISLIIGASAVAPFNPGGITARALTTTAGAISLQSTTASTVAGNVAFGTGSLSVNNAGAMTISGVISGTGATGLTKTGAGILTLSGANTYTSATNINVGTLSGIVGPTSAVTLANIAGVTYNLNGANRTIGSLAGGGATGGNVTLGASTLTTGGDNTSTTFSGIISGTGGLIKAGTGTFTLSGVNTYTGVTNVNAGTLVAASNNALGTAAGGTTVASGATLGFSGGINYATAEPVTLNGGTLSNVAGNNTFAGPTTLTANSTITVTNGTTMTLGGTVNGGSQLTVSSGTGNINFLGAIGGVTPLSSLAATVGSISLGPVTTTGSQSYTGITTLNGNLTTTNSTITLNSPVTLAANTILNTGAGAIAFGNTLNGAFSLTANSTGTTTFGGIVGGTTALTSVTTNAGGTTAINGGAITTTGNQTYNDAVTLGANTVLTGATPTFGSTVTGGNNDLTLSFTGLTTVNGANFTGIRNFTSNNGGTTQLIGAFSTSGSQTYTDAVTLTGATTLTSTGNQAIAFNSTVDGAQTLAVNTTGTTTFGGIVGGTTALTSVTTNAGGTTAINGGAITTTGAQTYK